MHTVNNDDFFDKPSQKIEDQIDEWVKNRLNVVGKGWAINHILKEFYDDFIYSSHVSKIKPLTKEKILEILCVHLDKDDDIEEEMGYEIAKVRAIEKALGIKD